MDHWGLVTKNQIQEGSGVRVGVCIFCALGEIRVEMSFALRGTEDKGYLPLSHKYIFRITQDC